MFFSYVYPISYDLYFQFRPGIFHLQQLNLFVVAGSFFSDSDWMVSFKLSWVSPDH